MQGPQNKVHLMFGNSYITLQSFFELTASFFGEPFYIGLLLFAVAFEGLPALHPYTTPILRSSVACASEHWNHEVTVEALNCRPRPPTSVGGRRLSPSSMGTVAPTSYPATKHGLLGTSTKVTTQRAQYPIIKEYSFYPNMKPLMI